MTSEPEAGREPSRAARTAVLALANGATTVVSIALAASLSRMLPIEQYAVYREALLFATMASAAAIMGVPHAINFFLYVITSENFRRELQGLFPWCAQKSKKLSRGTKKTGEMSSTSGNLDSGGCTAVSQIKSIA